MNVVHWKIVLVLVPNDGNTRTDDKTRVGALESCWGPETLDSRKFGRKEFGKQDISA
jgi:hypothetical protein